jgi:hypothetical protein
MLIAIARWARSFKLMHRFELSLKTAPFERSARIRKQRSEALHLIFVRPCDNLQVPQWTSSCDARKRKYFLWGTILTWTLSVPVVIGIFHALRGISEAKATGLGAIVSGLAEAYVVFGLILAVILPVGANCPTVQIVFRRTLGACLIFAALHLWERTDTRFRRPVRVAFFHLPAPYSRWA